MLHAGHVECLLAAGRKAAELGIPLLVAINSDDSIRRLKGRNRPVNSLVHRAKVLCALRPVDAVVWFDDDTPLELIKYVRPKLLVKAGDYKGQTIVGARFVRSIGGQVWLAPYVKGLSTSGMLRKGGARGQRS